MKYLILICLALAGCSAAPVSTTEVRDSGEHTETFQVSSSVYTARGQCAGGDALSVSFGDAPGSLSADCTVEDGVATCDAAFSKYPTTMAMTWVCP